MTCVSANRSSKGYCLGTNRVRTVATLHSSWNLSSGCISESLAQLNKLIKCCVCLDVNQGGTNHSLCTQRLVILHAQTY